MPENTSTRNIIARRVRDERKRLGWTLEDLAARASVSRGMISKIERGESDPTAALLARLADAMAVSMSALMSAPPVVRPTVSRLADQKAWVDPSTKYVRRMVWPTSHPGEVEVVAVELPAGQTASFPATRQMRASEQVLLLQGQLTISAGEQRFELAPGDCALFPTDQPHAFSNPGKAACRYLVLRPDAAPGRRLPVEAGLE